MPTKTFHHLTLTDEWNDGTNWSPSGVPGSSDDVVLPGNPIIDTDVGEIASLETTSTEGVYGGVSFRGSALTVDGDATDNTAILLQGEADGASLTVKGTLDVSGGALNLDSSTGIGDETVTVHNLVGSNTSILSLSGGPPNDVPSSLAALLIDSSAGITAPGVLDGTVKVSGNAVISFHSGFITTIATNAQLALSGPKAFLASVDQSSDSALDDLASNAGYVTFDDGAVVRTTGDLTNTGSLSVDDDARALIVGQQKGGSTLTIGGTLINTGDNSFVSIGSDAIIAPTLVTVAALDNTQRILITGSAQNLAELRVEGEAGFGTAGVLQGDIDLAGKALLDFTKGQITSIASDSYLTLESANAFVADADDEGRNSALDGLTSVDGVLVLTGGASAAVTGALDVNGQIDLEGGGSLTVKGSLSNASLLFVGAGADAAGSTLTAADVSNAGTIAINAPETFYTSNSSIGGGLSSMAVNALTGGGTVDVGVNATLEVDGAGDNAIVFSGPNAVLKLDDPAAGYTGAISGFGAGDRLDLVNEVVTIQGYDGTTLVVRTADGTTQSFALAGPPKDGLVTQSDGAGGTDIVVCFAEGTLIATPLGEVPVERLRIGDLVSTTSGPARPVRWLGHRRMDLTRHPDPDAARPVRIAAHALGPDRPSRDLTLSPGHAICIDVLGEVLVPAIALVNGSTVRQIEVEAVTYWHVELDGHDILLADNCPAESYIDTGNRRFFAESGVVDLGAGPDAPAGRRGGVCRPYYAEGPLVEVVHSQVRARAERLGWRLDEQGLAGAHLLVDGKRIEPECNGDSLRFRLPAGAAEAWLVSGTGVPRDGIAAARDRRRLGLCVGALGIEGPGAGARRIMPDDPRLGAGFHAAEHGDGACWRWTDGRARLPGALWTGCGDEVVLCVDLTGPALPRWVAPTTAARSARAA